MEQEAFEKLVDEGFAAIPERYRKQIKNVVLVIEDEPSPEVREIEGLGPEDTLLGYYHGVPVGERGSGYGIGGTMPDRITIYQKPIEEAAGDDPDRIRHIVADTIWHEFGHHFGLEEDEVEKREHERGMEK